MQVLPAQTQVQKLPMDVKHILFHGVDIVYKMLKGVPVRTVTGGICVPSVTVRAVSAPIPPRSHPLM